MIFKLLLPVPAFSGALAVFAFAGGLQGQTAAPSPSPAKKIPTGFLRLINATDPVEKVAYELSVSPDPAVPPLQTSAPGSFYGAYERVKPGRYPLRITRAGNRDLTIKTLDANVADKSYFTVIVYPDAAGAMIAELVDETPDLKAPPVNRLAVRQLCKDLRVVVSSGGVRTDPLDYGRSQVLEKLPDGKSNVQIRAMTAKGPRNWGSEVDFSAGHRATVFVAPDPYGRMRARLTVDGPDAITEKEDRESAAPASP